MKTSDFIDFFTCNVTKQTSLQSFLKEKGVIFVDELDITINKTYESQLYYGYEPQYKDFFMNFDIRHPDLKNIVEDVKNNKKNTVISIYGKSYVGKTCVSKRLLMDFKKELYITMELTRIHNISENILEYLKNCPQNSKIVMLIEEASSQNQYYDVSEIIHLCPKNISQLVIIAVDTIENYLQKNYIFRDKNIQPISIEIKEETNEEYVHNIFDTLDKKNKLGNLLGYANKKLKSNKKTLSKIEKEKKDIIVYKIRENNDIVETLFFVSNGRGFKEHYKKFMDTNGDTFYDEYLKYLCLLGEIGINLMPNEMIGTLIPEKNMEFNYNKFVRCYPDIIQPIGSNTKIGRRRLLMEVLDKCDSKTTQILLQQVALSTKEFFSENNRNQYTEIFQKSVCLNRIEKSTPLKLEEIYNLYKSIEGEFEDISYFRIQSGIACRRLKKFEEANNHLSYAQNIQPNSYQVKHALAKNWMEWGIHEIKTDSKSISTIFEKGKRMMEELIDDDIYRDAYRYSIHAYVDLLLEYTKLKVEKLTFDELSYIQNHLKRVISDGLDDPMKSLIKKFTEYCHSNNFKEWTEGLEKPRLTWDIVSSYNVDEKDLEIEEIFGNLENKLRVGYYCD